MEIFLQILIQDIGPIFLVAFVGWLLARRYQVDVRIFSQVGVNALLPCLIFDTFSNSQVNVLESGKIALFCLLIVIVSGLLARLGAIWLHVKGKLWSASGCDVQTLAIFACDYFRFGEPALAHATVYFVTMNILLYTLGMLSVGGWNEEILRSCSRSPSSSALVSFIGEPVGDRAAALRRLYQPGPSGNQCCWC
jgi:predicted permease